MYDDILKLILNKKSIYFVDYNKMNNSSHILQILLSGNSLSELSIIDSYHAVNFVKRNFKLDPTVELFPYRDISEMRQAVKRNSMKQSILVSPYSNDKRVEWINMQYDCYVWVFNKSEYKIINKQNEDTIYAQSN